MKILVIAGASRSVVWFRQELIKYLIAKGNEVVVVACDADNEDIIKFLGVEFHSVGGDNRDTGILSNLKYIKTMKKLIKEINPDKIMTFQAKANTFGIIAAKKAGYKDITAMVEGLGSVYNDGGIKIKIIRMISNILYKHAFKKIPTVIFLNEENRQKFLDMRLVKEPQCFLIDGIGVDIEKFKQDVHTPRDAVKFVMVARVERDKGIIEYCEAAKKLIDSGIENVSFDYYGACDDETNPILSYQDYVHYRGYTTDIYSALSDNDVMVLPSYYNEGLPRSIVEAMAMSMPIVTTNRPGCRVTVENGVNGFYVEDRSIDDLADKMQNFVNDTTLITTMGQASRRLAEQKFDSNVINNQIWERIAR